MKGKYQIVNNQWRRSKKGPLFRRVRKQRVKSITILPSLITILNGVFGFTAIVLASKGGEPVAGEMSGFAAAGYVVLLAMLADMLDGRLARMSQSTSSFGGQLDSLCDFISFGVAPAFIMLKLVESRLALDEVLAGGLLQQFVWLPGLLQRFVWLAALVYISCAAIRLARFNVENDENEVAHMSFVGLPSPGAAGVVISLIIFFEQQVPSLELVACILPFVTLGVAVLMVSSIRYPHVLNVYLRGKKPFSYLIRVLLFLALVIVGNIQTALVLIFGSFAGGSLAKWAYYKVRRRSIRLVLPHPDSVSEALPGPGLSE